MEARGSGVWSLLLCPLFQAPSLCLAPLQHLRVAGSAGVCEDGALTRQCLSAQGLTTSFVYLLVRVVRVVLLFCCLFKKFVSVVSSVLLLAPVSRSFPISHSSVEYLSFET